MFLGIYELTQDVTNPQPDKRFTRDWRAEQVFKKGTLYVLEEYIWEEGKKYKELTRLRDSYHRSISQGDGRYKLIFPHLVKVPESLDSVFLECNADGDWSKLQIVYRLFELNKFTLDDVREAAKTLRDEYTKKENEDA